MTNSTLPSGFTEATKGGLICSADLVHGGIIDQEIVSGLWFVIFNDDSIDSLNGFSTRDEAIAAFNSSIKNRLAINAVAAVLSADCVDPENESLAMACLEECVGKTICQRIYREHTAAVIAAAKSFRKARIAREQQAA